MALECEVVCINKANRLSPFERIDRIGIRYPNGWTEVLNLSVAVSFVETGQLALYVRHGYRLVRVHVVRSLLTDPFLQTDADDYGCNNLLSLPECTGAICAWGA